MRDSANLWAVLRCAGPSTLPLATSLAGFDVWTPTEIVTKRVPRANVKRKLTLALLPSYLFAPARYITDLLELAAKPIHEHKDFHVWHTRQGIPLIADESLEPLRLAERKRKPLERSLTPGEKVRLLDGGFEGLNGVIESARGEWAMVAIPGFRMPLKVATYHLLREGERRAA